MNEQQLIYTIEFFLDEIEVLNNIIKGLLNDKSATTKKVTTWKNRRDRFEDAISALRALDRMPKRLKALHLGNKEVVDDE